VHFSPDRNYRRVLASYNLTFKHNSLKPICSFGSKTCGWADMIYLKHSQFSHPVRSNLRLKTGGISRLTCVLVILSGETSIVLAINIPATALSRAQWAEVHSPCMHPAFSPIFRSRSLWLFPRKWRGWTLVYSFVMQ